MKGNYSLRYTLAFQLLFLITGLSATSMFSQPFTDSNYGAVLALWDRLLGTFKKLDPTDIRYGLDRYYPNEKDEDFMGLMKSPFTKQESK